MKNTTASDLYHYVESGLAYVWLDGGFVREETPYGPAVRVEHATELDREIALFLIGYQRRLSGAEVRFLRGLMDLTQKALAGQLGKDAQTVARWEKDETEVPPTEDRALRQLYLEHVGASQPFTETCRRVGALTGVVDAVVATGGDGARWRVQPSRRAA